jgi:uncharacterized membrane protein YccC
MLPPYGTDFLKLLASVFFVGIISKLTNQSVLGMGGLLAIYIYLNAHPADQIDWAAVAAGWAFLLIVLKAFDFIKRR